jgi:L-amino acid N-acyltransferase YncA
METSWDLGQGYSLRLGSREEIWPHIEPLMTTVFGGHHAIWPQYSDEEKEATRRLRQHMGSPLTLYFGLFHGEQIVGWHIGDQHNAARFYMRNSAIVPEHRRRGLYSAMLKAVVAHLLELGFQNILSRHNATNNAVIIPKLKAGFVMTGLEISDVFGTLVHLEYFANPQRRKAIDYRCGLIAPDEEILGWRNNPRPE